jgi:hypothetical protein
MDYCREQLANQKIVRDYLDAAGPQETIRLRAMCRDYLRFREEVAAFQKRYFQSHCRSACFQAQRSACCNKDGIITFFADLVINAVVSRPAELEILADSLRRPRQDMKCLYLGPQGCRWHLKPIVCEMFLCEPAQEAVFADWRAAGIAWEALRKRALAFRWPDRVVLFDVIEERFLAAGIRSSLMYLHHSPGLLRIKRKAGLL